MVVRSFLFCSAITLITSLSLVSSSSVSADISASSGKSQRQNLEKLRIAVKKHMLETYRERFQSDHFSRDVTITVGNLDPRLKLAACDEGLKFASRSPTTSSRRVSVKITCIHHQQRLWSIYVNANIDVYFNALVAVTNLPKGTILSRENLERKRVKQSIKSARYIEDIDQIIGKELTRALDAGTALHDSVIAQALVVTKGDQVNLSANNGFLTVDTPATALSSGRIGQTIRVRNLRSQKIVHARVIARNHVETLTSQ